MCDHCEMNMLYVWESSQEAAAAGYEVRHHLGCRNNLAVVFDTAAMCSGPKPNCNSLSKTFMRLSYTVFYAQKPGADAFIQSHMGIFFIYFEDYVLY